MKKVGEISWKTGIYNQTMKYNYNFSGEISWDTAYQMEGSPVQKKVKVVICVCVCGGEAGRTIVSPLVWPMQAC